MVAAKLANLQGAGRPSEIGGIQPISQERAANMLNVSRDSVKKAKKVAATAPEVAAVVERGEMSLNLATKVAALPEPERAYSSSASSSAAIRAASASAGSQRKPPSPWNGSRWSTRPVEIASGIPAGNAAHPSEEKSRCRQSRHCSD